MFCPTLATNFDIPVANWLIARLGRPHPHPQAGMVRFSHEVSELFRLSREHPFVPRGVADAPTARGCASSRRCASPSPTPQQRPSGAHGDHLPRASRAGTFFKEQAHPAPAHPAPRCTPIFKRPRAGRSSGRACCYSAMAEAYAAHSAPRGRGSHGRLPGDPTVPRHRRMPAAFFALQIRRSCSPSGPLGEGAQVAKAPAGPAMCRTGAQGRGTGASDAHCDRWSPRTRRPLVPINPP